MMRISHAITRPRPLAFCSSVCVMMPSSTNDRWARTWPCWCDGNTSMMRLMLSIAELVCSVANARWPVSAIVSAAPIVSRSRISPTSTTSGSCRNAYFRAAAKLLVSVPISRWFTMQLWWRWMNSIGSSTVMMLPFSSLLILSIIAASVLGFPRLRAPAGAGVAAPARCGGPPRPARSPPRARCGDSPCARRLGSCRCPLPGFFQGGEAALHLQHPVHAEREHAVLHRLLPQLLGRSALQDHAPHRAGHGHDLVQPLPALVPRAVAGVAPRALVQRQLRRFA